MPCLRFLEMRLIGQRGPICARARTGQPVVGDTAGCNSGDRHPASRSRSLGAAASRNHELQRVRVHVRLQFEENFVSTAKQRAVRAGKHHFAIGDEQFTASVFREVGECLSGAHRNGRSSFTDRRWTLDEVLYLGLGQTRAGNRREREQENQMPHATDYARGAEQSVKARSMHREISLPTVPPYFDC